MINAPYETEFVFQDGQRIKNLLELSMMLEKISQQDFERFVNPSKNDFANWIEYVLQDTALAASLRSTISFPKTKEMIGSRLIVEKYPSSSSSYSPKKSSFNIFKQNNNSTFVELKKPIEKLPEPEHHKIELLSDNITTQKRRWFDRKKHEKSPVIMQEKKTSDDMLKKDHSLRKWYEFRKNAKKDQVKNTDRGQLEAGVSDHGNVLWVFIYGALILLILALVVYKFVL